MADGEGRSSATERWLTGITRHPVPVLAACIAFTLLAGLAAVDLLDDGLSAIYTVFAPELEHRSLGTFAVLWQIEEAKRRELPHLYLGYWIKECRKMNYKTRFQPIEALRDGHWRKMSPD